MAEETGKRDNYIKVNLPADRESYESGNGEGVWVLVDDATKAAHDADVPSGTFHGTLDNDSWYWPGLSHGDEIIFEMRGENRPVVPFDWLNGEKSPRLAEAAKESREASAQLGSESRGGKTVEREELE